MLFHWVMASPSSRRFPDFRLGRWVNADHSTDSSFATSTVNTYTSPENRAERRSPVRNMGWGEKPLLMRTGFFQESVACDAMVFYEPLVGLTKWGEPSEDFTYANAGGDFGAFFDGFKRSNVKRAYEHIITQLAPLVTLEQAELHAKAVLLHNDE